MTVNKTCAITIWELNVKLAEDYLARKLKDGEDLDVARRWLAETLEAKP